MSSDPNQRPSFDEIVNKLRNSENFLAYNIGNNYDKFNIPKVDTFKSENRILILGDTGQGKCTLGSLLQQNVKPIVDDKKFLPFSSTKIYLLKGFEEHHFSFEFNKI